jgi:hypothetical protein
VELLQRSIGNRAVTGTLRSGVLVAPRGTLQRKLVVGRIDDPLEHEADRIANGVMRTPELRVSNAAAVPPLSRKCAACEEEEELRRQPVSPAALAGQAVPPIVHEVLAEPGRPLDAESRAFFEPHLGLDLGHVRVHDDARAASSARAVGARAYTVGSHIAFADGANIANEAGRRLLAHELVHVLQQSRGSLPQLARVEAAYTPTGASSALASAADTIAEYRRLAATALDGSGLAPADAARIRRNLDTCADGEERLRSVAAMGNDAESAAVLSAFTLEGMRRVLPRLTRVQPSPAAIALYESDRRALSAMPESGNDLSRPAEREAERVAAKLVPAGMLTGAPERSGVLRRLSGRDAVQIEQALAPAAPALVTGAAATAAAIATAPLWVWVVVAVVVVAIVVGVLYWAYSDDDTEALKKPQLKPAPQPEPELQPQPAPQPQLQPQTQSVPQECVDQAERLSRRNCGFFEARVMAPSTLNPQADEYCHDITGSGCEYWLRPARGRAALAKFDGVRGNEVIECKCGYDYYVKNLNSTDDRKRRSAEGKIWGEDGIIKQILSHLRYTQDCGLQYRLIVSSQPLADLIRDLLGNQVDVIVQPSELCD